MRSWILTILGLLVASSIVGIVIESCSIKPQFGQPKGGEMADLSKRVATDEQLTDHARPFGRLRYSDLDYLGAFRCPDTEDYAYANGALAYVPTADRLIVVGHRSAGQPWAELEIPTPAISSWESSAELPVAREAMPPKNIWREIAGKVWPAVAIGGLLWHEDRIWIACYEYYNAAGRNNPGLVSISDVLEPLGPIRGSWHVDPYHANVTSEYLMRIPASWADQYAPGATIACGRHREAGAFGGANGPSVIAFDPTRISGRDFSGKALMLYDSNPWPDYCDHDSYTATWIWSGNRQAVIVGAAKGLGLPGYYGEGRTCDKAKGYHCEPYEPRLYFMDVNELGDVARGKLLSHQPKPYEMVVPTELWRQDDPNCKRPWFGGFAFDEKNGRLFLSQPEAYATRFSNGMIIHVWSVR